MAKLRELRERSLLTQAELAALLRVATQRIGEWERAVATPRPANQRRLAEALGVAPPELLAALRETRATLTASGEDAPPGSEPSHLDW